MTLNGPTSQNGFTLVEVMVTVMIVMVAALAMGTFTNETISTDSLARQRTLAVYLAEDIIENWAATGELKPICDFTKKLKTQGADSTKYDFHGRIFTVDASASRMMAPPPEGSVSPLEPLDGPSKDPLERVIKVSWTLKGKTHSVRLVHATAFGSL